MTAVVFDLDGTLVSMRNNNDYPLQKFLNNILSTPNISSAQKELLLNHMIRFETTYSSDNNNEFSYTAKRADIETCMHEPDFRLNYISTLLHTKRQEDVFTFWGFERPYAKTLIASSFQKFKYVFVYTASDAEYASAMFHYLSPNKKPHLILSANDCDFHKEDTADPTRITRVTKYLNKLTQHPKFPKDLTTNEIFIVDDRHTFPHHNENHILIPEFITYPTSCLDTLDSLNESYLLKLKHWFLKINTQNVTLLKPQFSKIWDTGLLNLMMMGFRPHTTNLKI